jgi:hypothetical protein
MSARRFRSRQSVSRARVVFPTSNVRGHGCAGGSSRSGVRFSRMRAGLLRLGHRAAGCSGWQRGAAALLTAFVSLVVAPGPSMGASNPVLEVAFSAQGSASVTSADGSPVGSTGGAPTVIAAGYYAIALSGPAGITAQIDIDGPGVSVDGSLDACASGTTYEAYFEPNSTYTWREPSAPGVVGTFVTSGEVVGSPPPSTGSSSPTGSASGSSQGLGNQGVVGSAATAVPLRGTLLGSVSRSGSLDLTFKGKPVVRLLAGNYTITVTDNSAKSRFILQENLEPPITISGLASVGKRTLTLDLTAGRWFFTPSILGKRTYFTVSS